MMPKDFPRQLSPSLAIEEAIRNGDVQLGALFNAMNEGFCLLEVVCDAAGHPCDVLHLMANPAYERHTGQKLADIIGRTAKELHPDIEPYWIERFGRVGLTGEPAHFEAMFGTLGRWFDVRAYQTGPGRLALMFDDTTERRNADQALRAALAEAERANRAKSRFLAAASHDLRQPLAALTLYADLLDQGRTPSGQKVLASMKDCIRSLSSLLSDLLDLSKLEAGVVSPNICNFAMVDTLTSLESVHAPEARLKGLELRCLPCTVTARSDPVLVQRILGNIIDNAIRYTEHGGVLVACRRRRGKIWVEVWDTGVGIHADKIKEAFEEFKQLGDEARTSGSGLGLAIVAKTAALLGLEIDVRSRPGRGSVFALELPPGAEAPLSIAGAPPSAACRPVKIGLVDDNPLVRTALTAALESLGHQLIAAADKTRLLADLGPVPPRLVITDYRLAGGETGFDVISAVRKQYGAEIPAILITGDTDPALLRSMAERGIVVLHKPLELETLRACLAKLTDEGAA